MIVEFIVWETIIRLDEHYLDGSVPCHCQDVTMTGYRLTSTNSREARTMRND